VSIHYVLPSLFFGFGHAGRQNALVASPEKALVDFAYLSPARSGLFRALPEVELPRAFSRHTVREMAAKIALPRRRTMVEREIERLFAAATTRGS